MSSATLVMFWAQNETEQRGSIICLQLHMRIQLAHTLHLETPSCAHMPTMRPSSGERANLFFTLRLWRVSWCDMCADRFIAGEVRTSAPLRHHGVGPIRNLPDGTTLVAETMRRAHCTNRASNFIRSSVLGILGPRMVRPCNIGVDCHLDWVVQTPATLATNASTQASPCPVGLAPPTQPASRLWKGGISPKKLCFVAEVHSRNRCCRPPNLLTEVQPQISPNRWARGFVVLPPTCHGPGHAKNLSVDVQPRHGGGRMSSAFAREIEGEEGEPVGTKNGDHECACEGGLSDGPIYKATCCGSPCRRGVSAAPCARTHRRR